MEKSYRSDGSFFPEANPGRPGGSTPSPEEDDTGALEALGEAWEWAGAGTVGASEALDPSRWTQAAAQRRDRTAQRHPTHEPWIRS